MFNNFHCKSILNIHKRLASMFYVSAKAIDVSGGMQRGCHLEGKGPVIHLFAWLSVISLCQCPAPLCCACLWQIQSIFRWGAWRRITPKSGESPQSAKNEGHHKLTDYLS